jgi:hypothetical protein
MSDIRYSINLTAAKGPFAQAFNAAGLTATMETAGMLAVTLNLGTSVSTINTATMSALGLCVARSLATTTTHTVSFGRYDGATLHESFTLRAGEAGVMRLAAGNYAAKAAVPETRLVLQIFEG